MVPRKWVPGLWITSRIHNIIFPCHSVLGDTGCSFKTSSLEYDNKARRLSCHSNADGIFRLPKTSRQDGGGCSPHVLSNGVIQLPFWQSAFVLHLYRKSRFGIEDRCQVQHRLSGQDRVSRRIPCKGLHSSRYPHHNLLRWLLHDAYDALLLRDISGFLPVLPYIRREYSVLHLLVGTDVVRPKSIRQQIWLFLISWSFVCLLIYKYTDFVWKAKRTL